MEILRKQGSPEAALPNRILITSREQALLLNFRRLTVF
jgi:hypothetical protein